MTFNKMTFKNRVIILVSLIALLAVTYIVSIIVNTNTSGAKTSLYSWLDSKAADRVTKIVVGTDEQDFELVKKMNQWFVLHDTVEYPARQTRIEDFLKILTTRSSWPVRSTSASTHERFGLTENASRITVYGEVSVLLDLLIGADDIFRGEVYFRKIGQNDVRSGDGGIKVYTEGPISSWYNLRLLSGSDASIELNNVQRVSVIHNNQTQVFTRRNRAWEISGISVTTPSQSTIENYLRTLLNTEGDSFENTVSREDPMFKNQIIFELGNGRVITIYLSDADETGRILAFASGREFVYSIPSWSAGRIFRGAESFEAN